VLLKEKEKKEYRELSEHRHTIPWVLKVLKEGILRCWA
jgi:hypothetical protein